MLDKEGKGPSYTHYAEFCSGDDERALRNALRKRKSFTGDSSQVTLERLARIGREILIPEKEILTIN